MVLEMNSRFCKYKCFHTQIHMYWDKEICKWHRCLSMHTYISWLCPVSRPKRQRYPRSDGVNKPADEFSKLFSNKKNQGSLETLLIPGLGQGRIQDRRLQGDVKIIMWACQRVCIKPVWEAPVVDAETIWAAK